MKKALIILAFIGAITATEAQTIKRDQDGNFHAIKTETVKQDTATNYTYTDGKGAKHKVYISKTGKYYIARTSKNGNFYRQYLKTEE